MHTSKKYNRIKVELTEAGKLSAELAVFLGVHASTVSDWCTNTNQPSIQDLYRIADFLQTDVRNLLVPNFPKPGVYMSAATDLNMAAEPETPYNIKSKSSKATGKPKPKKKKPSP